ncbi:SAM-dependent methyltransferase, partial [Neisseria sp. P0009.S004]
MNPVLYLIPTPLGAPDPPCLLPHEQQAIVGLTEVVGEA